MKQEVDDELGLCVLNPQIVWQNMKQDHAIKGSYNFKGESFSQ